MNRLNILSTRNHFTTSRGSFFLLLDTWRSIKKDLYEIKRYNKPGVFEYDYWTMIKDMLTDDEIGREKQEKTYLEDNILINKFRKKFDLTDNCRIIYTDGSKRDSDISTGISIIIENEEIGFTMSIDKKCSVFSAELLAIEKILGYVQEQEFSERYSHTI